MKPAFPTREDFICAWITLAKAERGTGAHENSFWAFEHMYDLIHEQPETAFGLIVEIWGRDQSRPVIQQLSAGPLEDLLAAHGERMIQAIEKQAAGDPTFRKLLGGVWKNKMKDSVWASVREIWDRRGWDGIPE
jgi:hypothetical protein